MVVQNPGQRQDRIPSQFRLGTGLLLAQLLQRLAHEAVGMQRLNVLLGGLEPQCRRVPKDGPRFGAAERAALKSLLGDAVDDYAERKIPFRVHYD